MLRRAALASVPLVLLACGGAAPTSTTPATCPAPGAAATTTRPGEPTPGVTPPVDGTPAAPAWPWRGQLVFEDSDVIRSFDLARAALGGSSMRANLVEGLRNVDAGGATWVHWKDTALKAHALRLSGSDGGLATLIVEPEVDDVAPDGTLAIVACPKKPGATCLVSITADGLGTPAPIKWPKGAGRVHGWSSGHKVLVLVSTSLKKVDLIEFEPLTGKTTPRGTLPRDAQAFFDRDGKFVAWFEGGKGKPLALTFREVLGKDDALQRLDLGVAHDARCEPTPANDAWACQVFAESGGPGRLVLGTVADLAVRELATGLEKVFGPLAWSPGGDAVAVSLIRGDKSALAIVPLAGGEPTTVWQDEANFVSRPRPLGWLK